MEHYKLKEGLEHAVAQRLLPHAEELADGPGLLRWDEVEAYGSVDPQNGRLRWLIDDLERLHAFELLWIPPSLRYYDTGSIYETEEAGELTKRLIFSGWAFVPKVISSLVSLEAERRAFSGRGHAYSDDYSARGGQRLTFRTEERSRAERAGEGGGSRRAAGMTAFLIVWPSLTLAELGDPRPRGAGSRPGMAELLAGIEADVSATLAPLVRSAPKSGPVDQRWYWAAPLFLDESRRQKLTASLLHQSNAEWWEGREPGENFLIHQSEARAMAAAGPDALGRPPEDLARVLAEVGLGGPAQCALRALASATGLPLDDEWIIASTAWLSSAFRSFFNAPEVTWTVLRRQSDIGQGEDGTARYWRAVIGHAIQGNLQAVLDEHAHIVRDWLGYVDISDEERRREASDDISGRIADALETRTSSFSVDIARRDSDGPALRLDKRTMRTRFAVAFGDQTLDDGGMARVGAVSNAFNSPFWPFVLTSTSVGQEGLDFHLWCHAVVHWNLPSNPVDLEQREGRVHRYKGHAVRRNIAATVGDEAFADGISPGTDPWDELFGRAAAISHDDAEMSPYWVFPGPAKIQRHVPSLPFSNESANLPRLRKALATYRLAFGQPRQEELIEFLGAEWSDDDLVQLASRLQINLSPPQAT